MSLAFPLVFLLISVAGGFTTAEPNVALRDLVPEVDTVREIVRIGTPSALEQSTSALAMSTLTAMVVTFASPVVAAYGLGNRLDSLVFLPAMGLGRMPTVYSLAFVANWGATGVWSGWRSATSSARSPPAAGSPAARGKSA